MYSFVVTTVAVLFCMAALKPGSLLVGGDVSEIPQVEAGGGQYFWNGKPEDPFVAMRKAGWNFVRFRVWNDPKARGGWCDKAHTLALAKRAAKEKFKISIDFHYSDWWADPGKQNKPAAWKDLPFDQLVKAVHGYTAEVIGELVKQGTPPFMVQIGNEITPGMLWPDGKVSGDDPVVWGRLAKLLQAGIDGVHDVQGKNKIRTMMHLDRGGDNKACHWWFDNLKKTGVEFDDIGLSYYPWWHGHLPDMIANVDDLAKTYNKDIYIVETAYPWCRDPHQGPHVYNGPGVEEGFPDSPEGQAGFMRKLRDVVQNIPNGRGKGILYWAPLWISDKKHHSDYMNLATFDDKGLPLPAMKALGGKK